jgi:RNA polymerase sigma factor (sigma-70 family)
MAKEDDDSPPAPDERWRSLIEQYGRYLRHVIVRHCPRDLGLSFDDIEQEARLRLWKALRDERKIDDPASYLYRIAATATIDAIRRVKARREEPLEPAGDEEGAFGEVQIADAKADLEPSASRALLLGRVQEVLGQFPPERRRLIGLHLQGFTSQEIADLHGWTEPKARNLVSRALRDLRENLRALGIEYEGD